MARTENKTGGAAVSDRWIAWGLALLTLLLYAQTAAFDFINLDDPLFITENVHVSGGLTPSSIWWALTTSYINWQPLVYLSHMAVVTVFGLDPAAHHLVNALLHAANAALFFLVLRRMRLPMWPSAAAAAIFAFHPLRLESVAWVTERKDVLSSLFWLLTMGAYVRYTEAPKERQRYLAVIAYFVLGLMSKPMLVTLPVALLILDFWPLDRLKAASVRDLVLEKVPLALLAAGVAIVTIVTQQSAGAMSSLNALPLSLRLANVIRSYALYLWKTVWPTDLAIVYPFPTEFPPIEVAFSLLVLAGLSYVAWVRRHSAPWWLAGWAWYVIVLAPTIGFIQVGPQPYADRYTYLPSLLPLAAIAFAAARSLSSSMFRIAAIGLAVVFGVLSWSQLGIWHDDLALYRHAIAVAPGSSIVHRNLGVALERSGRFDEAIANYKVGMEIAPRDAALPLNIGLAYLQSNRPAEAVGPLSRAVEMDPAAAAPRLHYSRALVGVDRLDDALAQLKKALSLSASNEMTASLHMQIGVIAYIRKDDNAALASFLECLRLDPSFWPARKNAGIALGNLGRNREAVEQLELYLKSNPQDKDIAGAIAALRSAK